MFSRLRTAINILSMNFTDFTIFNKRPHILTQVLPGFFRKLSARFVVTRVTGRRG